MTTAVVGDVLVIDRVVRRYRQRTALDRVSLAVAAGQLCGLVGANGAGKTTLLRVVAGYLDVDAGCVTIDGVDVSAARHRAASRRGVLIEGAPLPPELGVGEYLRLRLRLRRLPMIDIGAALAAAGLAERAGDAIGTLSKGQRQRVAWIEAQLGAPPLLLLDEPAAGLDEPERQAVRDRLLALRGQRTILWASHELSDVEAVADRIAVMVAGTLVAIGDMIELRRAAGVSDDASLRTVIAGLSRCV
jgi:ABC-type multidrug transport system ATPase subunit